MAEFFSLPHSKLRELFQVYATNYGQGAASYATRTYWEWKSGSKDMAGQTLQRLIEVVPLVLSFEQKLELYRKLRSGLLRSERVVITVTAPEEIPLVERTAWRIAERSKSQPLPPLVDARLLWLAQGDGLLARQLVAATELEEGERVAGAVAKEVRELQQIFSESVLRKDVQHTVELPYGEITVKFRRPSILRRLFMNNDGQSSSNNLPMKREEPTPARDIIDLALQQGGSQEIMVAAQKEALRLAAKGREGEMDAEAARQELQEFLEQADEATRLQGTIDMEADFKRASGKTRISVRKKSRWWWPF